MPIPKIEITNPEAVELINKFKSREIFVPITAWLKKYKWIIISISIVIILITALAIGKKLSEQTPIPVFTPPDIETLSPTETITIKSDYSGLKEDIQNLNTDLPDPFIPSFDDAINLEETVN